MKNDGWMTEDIKEFKEWQIGIAQKAYAMWINDTNSGAIRGIFSINYLKAILDDAIRKYGLMAVCPPNVPLTNKGWLEREEING